MEDYFLKIKSILDHLATVGEIDPNQNLIFYATHGLDPQNHYM